MVKKILLIIPAYNEEANILKTYQKIDRYNQNNPQNHFDVIVINDCSTDRTEEICIENRIQHINLVHNLGIGGAVQTGYKFALKHKYDIAVQYDGDGQHDVNFVKDICQPIIDGEADFTIGSRFISGSTSEFKSSGARRAGIKMISRAIKRVTKTRIYDTTSGFRAVNAKIIKEFSSFYPVEYPEPITSALLLRKGYKVKEVPVEMHEREGGVSSINSWKNAYYMINVLMTIYMVGTRRSDNVE